MTGCFSGNELFSKEPLVRISCNLTKGYLEEKVQNQHIREISLLKLHESSVTMSVCCEFFWIQKNGKTLTSTFSRNKGNLLLWTVNSSLRCHGNGTKLTFYLPGVREDQKKIFQILREHFQAW